MRTFDRCMASFAAFLASAEDARLLLLPQHPAAGTGFSILPGALFLQGKVITFVPREWVENRKREEGMQRAKGWEREELEKGRIERGEIWEREGLG